MPTERHVDDGRTVYQFLVGDVLVECPRCRECAVVIPATMNPRARMDLSRPLWSARRLSCLHCGYSADRPATGITFDADRDPFFRERLWLRTSVRGELLWAYNETHLNRLAEFVGARLRERHDGPRRRRRPFSPGCRMTMDARLPPWMKDAKNRDAVVAGIERLRRRLP